MKSREISMKYIVSLLLLLVVTGCTRVTLMEMPVSDLHRELSRKEIIKAGDKVTILASNQTEYTFKVTEVTENYVIGKGVQVPIQDIVSLKKLTFHLGKTITLAAIAANAAAIVVLLLTFS